MAALLSLALVLGLEGKSLVSAVRSLTVQSTSAVHMPHWLQLRGSSPRVDYYSDLVQHERWTVC